MMILVQTYDLASFRKYNETSECRLYMILVLYYEMSSSFHRYRVYLIY